MPRVGRPTTTTRARVRSGHAAAPPSRSVQHRVEKVENAIDARVRGIDAAITFARATRKSAGPEGIEPLLSSREEARVRDVLDHASPAVATHLRKLVATPEHAVGS